jgi:hypothetical protein
MARIRTTLARVSARETLINKKWFPRHIVDPIPLLKKRIDAFVKIAVVRGQTMSEYRYQGICLLFLKI